MKCYYKDVSSHVYTSICIYIIIIHLHVEDLLGFNTQNLLLSM